MFKSIENTYGFSMTASHSDKGLHISVGYNLGANSIVLNPEEALKLYNYLGEVYGKGTPEVAENKVNSKETVSKPS